MKPHIHKIMNLLAGEVIGVQSDAQAFVFYADTDSYAVYLNDVDYDYYGSAVKDWPFCPTDKSPYNLQWNS